MAVCCYGFSMPSGLDSASPGWHPPAREGSAIAPKRFRCHGDAVFPCQLSGLGRCLGGAQSFSKGRVDAEYLPEVMQFIEHRNRWFGSTSVGCDVIGCHPLSFSIQFNLEAPARGVALLAHEHLNRYLLQGERSSPKSKRSPTHCSWRSWGWGRCQQQNTGR
jgi:hypothetical protein